MILFTNKTQSENPKIPWGKIKKCVLGDGYELSIVFCGDKVIKSLNRRYNKKTRATNILSFALTEDSGEIFINLSRVKKESERAGIGFLKRLEYLYTHSLFHLKGFRHGKEMEKEEQKIMSFNFKV
ncbi:MAG: rRNA maturation RNase YbeY [Candidatus Tagabacteria bacterium RIFCSPLOWO2_01_FULL_39_11]|uniref:Endoribonuclease YbeY n=1 Tax=Candidatus Tagabacteria bacterium RIFCSPLOWO2_01_FULL_39_11 TaxID=1802295 RepID=A0A1G2LTI8_9BACT|nr:MAG: rRNA maturation RNase YbeY [Candidatus Tagabacteria bacterium RIFCSPLOWO2_01_FULL_39_11]